MIIVVGYLLPRRIEQEMAKARLTSQPIDMRELAARLTVDAQKSRQDAKSGAPVWRLKPGEEPEPHPALPGELRGALSSSAVTHAQKTSHSS